ncbi:hypothetical protein QPL79_04825 [Ignisphaera sp. 4213-co]|uniref:Uncharacterized protein n=1 Tax=Ignisphaera cupida TaxID=3050454 RepID=A0ABD4Z6Y6_9CREN|nr:hypothetical protein [Ignisphaera sp. 4213-co]MDK6028678.1 hypothetical protein [Ignisphaera sp. 4213-co]
MLLNEPEKLRNILLDKYGDTTSVYFIIKYLLLRPLLIEKNRLDKEEELATSFLNNPEEFKKMLSSLFITPRIAIPKTHSL